MKYLKHRFIHASILCMMLAGILGLIISSPEAMAAEAGLNPDQTGSIVVTIKTKEKPVTEGSLLLYKVADLIEEDGKFCFESTAEFKDSIFSQKKIESADLAIQLEKFVIDKKLAGREMPVNQKGIAKAKGLETGVYLLIQGQEAKDVEPISSFLVTVPLKEDGKYIYDVDASPKVDLKKTDSPDNPPNKTTPPGKLPQTGQLWWPVPLLLIFGFWLVMIGFIKNR